MATTLPEVATGTTITWDSGFCTAKVRGINWTGISRESVETTQFETLIGKTFMPGDLFDPGEVSIDMLFDVDAEPPWETTDVADTFTVTFPGGSSWSCSAFLIGFEWSGQLEEVLSATMTLKCTGNITVS